MFKVNNQSGFGHLIIIFTVILVFSASLAAYKFVSTNNNSTSSEEFTYHGSNRPINDVDHEENETNSNSENKTSTDSVNDESHTSTNEEGQSNDSSPSSNNNNSNNNTLAPSTGGSSGGNNPKPQTKLFNIDSFSFGYSMRTMGVSPGDVVTVNLTNSGGKHDWVIDEISGASTKIINGGQTDSITFTVPQNTAGKTFKFYCSVGNHRALGMEGVFIVSL